MRHLDDLRLTADKRNRADAHTNGWIDERTNNRSVSECGWTIEWMVDGWIHRRINGWMEDRRDDRMERKGNVLFNDALNTFYLRLYGVRHMVKDHSDSEKGNPLPPHRLLFPITARVLLYAPSHRQDSTYHGFYYTSRGALAGTRNSSMGSPHEGSIRRPIAPWANWSNGRVIGCMDKKINGWMEGWTRDRETDRSMGVWMGWLCRRVKGRSLCIKRWMDG